MTADRLRALKLTGHDESGQFLAMTVVFMTMFLVLLGLVADGGQYLDANQAAATEASQAARTGAGALDPGQLQAGVLGLANAQAIQAAEAYMVTVGHPGTAWVVGNTVYARVTYQMPTQVLGIIGISSMHVDATAQATNVAGT